MAKPTIEQLDASLAKWFTRLKRSVTTIDKLSKQRKRMANAIMAEQAEAKRKRTEKKTAAAPTTSV